MGRPSKWSSPTTAIRIPEKYSTYFECLARTLEEIEGFVQNPVCPFGVGDRVLVPFAYPDDYRIVDVLELCQEKSRIGYQQFYFQLPDLDHRCRWGWYIGSGVVVVGSDESLESAICRSVLQRSLNELLWTEFRTKRAGLDWLSLKLQEAGGDRSSASESQNASDEPHP